MEPFPGVEPGSATIPRSRGRRSEGHELGKRDLDAHLIASKATWLPVTPFPIKSPSPGSNWAGRPYKGLPDAGPKGAVRSAGVEPASTWPSTKPVYLFAARAHGAATRCRTGPPALRGQGRKPCAASKVHRSGSWGRTNVDGFRGRRPAIRRSRISAEGAIRTHMPRGLSSRGLAGSLHSRVVRRQGLEPRPRHRLRACRSTIELAARAVPGSRTPMICSEGKCLPVSVCDELT